MGRTDYKGGMEGGEATRGRAMIDTLCGKMSIIKFNILAWRALGG